MKRQIQLRGERDWAGDDLIALQSEPLKAIDNLFSGYPSCVISGCAITAVGDRYNISPGLVSIHGQNHDDQKTSMVVPFAGATQVVLPAYLTLKYNAINDIYGDGINKPIAYDYTASVTNIKPIGDSYIEITSNGCISFLDVLQDDEHTFVTQEERDKWNSIYEQISEEVKQIFLVLYQAIIDLGHETTDCINSEIAKIKVYTDTEIGKANTHTNTKFTEAKSYSDAKLTEAKTHTNSEVTKAKTHTDTKFTEAKSYSDVKLAEANTYTNSEVAKANTHANTKFAEAKSYSDAKLIEAKAYTSSMVIPLEKINLIIGRIQYPLPTLTDISVDQIRGSFTVEERERGIGEEEGYIKTGIFRIHHNLNTYRYIVDVYVDGRLFGSCVPCLFPSNNYIDIKIYNISNVTYPVLTEFTFKITTY